MDGIILAILSVMPRPILIRTDEFPYHITCRTNNKEWFPIDIKDCWNILINYLEIVSDKYGLKIVSFVLMSNHFHLIASTPFCNIDVIMNYLLREVSKEIGRKAGRINHIFGNKYKWSLIQNDLYFSHAYKYLIRNPVKASIVSRVEDYDYSTFAQLVNGNKLPFDCDNLTNFGDEFVPSDLNQRLEWLNQPYHPNENSIIRKALNRSIFQFTKNKTDEKWVKGLLLKRYPVPVKEDKNDLFVHLNR
jgi:putative transposase